MSIKFAVVYEADADFTIATQLADRVLVEAIEWLEEDQLDLQRTWLAEISGGMRTTWKSIKKLAREAGVRAHGHFDGAPGLPDATAARKAIEFLLVKVPDLHAILLIRDQDDQPERKAGLEQARRENRHPQVQIVIGLANTERECWVLSGFDPENEDERQTLDKERQALGFNPCLRSHELTACKNDAALKSPKRVLKLLTNDTRERQERAWQVTSLAVLRERGTENGLSAYLDEVKQRLTPLILGHRVKK